MYGMEKAATDIYTFENLRSDGFTYVDKTAMPTFLMEFFKEHPMDVSSLKIDESELEAYEPERLKPVTLLFQTGYLTIMGFEQDGADRTYTLGFPNLEVENSFLKNISTIYIGREESETANIIL